MTQDEVIKLMQGNQLPQYQEFTHFSPSCGSEAAQAEILTPIGWQRTLCYRDAWLRDFQTAIA